MGAVLPGGVVAPLSGGLLCERFDVLPGRLTGSMALAFFANQLVAWCLATVFRSRIAAWGWDTMFYFFAANAILYFVTVLFIPETKGKSLSELETLFWNTLL